jgi:hypothetical protein
MKNNNTSVALTVAMTNANTMFQSPNSMNEANVVSPVKQIRVAQMPT